MIHQVGVTDASSLTAITGPATINPSSVASARPPRNCLRRKRRAVLTSVVSIVYKAHLMRTVAIRTGVSGLPDASTLPIPLPARFRQQGGLEPRARVHLSLR